MTWTLVGFRVLDQLGLVTESEVFIDLFRKSLKTAQNHNSLLTESPLEGPACLSREGRLSKIFRLLRCLLGGYRS
jgi:hypothetical protein